MGGDLELLGRRWPSAAVRPWWRAPDAWRIDPVSGRPWPGADRFAWDAPLAAPGFGDVKFVWELNRLQSLAPLALHARLSGDDAAASAVFDMLGGWMTANPPFCGIAWRGGVEAATRVLSLLAALAFVEPETETDRAAVGAFLRAHVRWIERYPSRFSSANNHRAAEATALFLAAICAPGLFPLARVAALQQEAEAAFLAQFHPDGVGREQAPAYAALSLEWFVLAGVAADALGRPFGAETKAQALRAAEALRWLLDAGGRAPRIGDADDSRALALTLEPEPRYVASVVALAARWLGGSEPQRAMRDPALRDLIGPPLPASAPPEGTRTFPDGGLTVWRRSGPDGDLLLAFDHGPLGCLSIAAHGHADALAIWLHWGEEDVLVDPGMHLYHADAALRSDLRGTTAHNTLTLDGRDQSRIVGPFAWARHARARLISASSDAAEAQHDGYRQAFGLLHRRRVRRDGDEILIEDRLIGSAPPRAWSVGFTLGAGVSAALSGPAAHLTTIRGRRLRLESLPVAASPAPAWTIGPTPYAPRFGAVETAQRLRLSGLAGGGCLVARVRLSLAPHQQSPT